MRDAIVSWAVIAATAVMLLLAAGSGGCQPAPDVTIYAPTVVMNGARYEKRIYVRASDGRQMSDLVDADVRFPLTAP